MEAARRVVGRHHVGHFFRLESSWLVVLFCLAPDEHGDSAEKRSDAIAGPLCLGPC